MRIEYPNWAASSTVRWARPGYRLRMAFVSVHQSQNIRITRPGRARAARTMYAHPAAAKLCAGAQMKAGQLPGVKRNAALERR